MLLFLKQAVCASLIALAVISVPSGVASGAARPVRSQPTAGATGAASAPTEAIRAARAAFVRRTSETNPQLFTTVDGRIEVTRNGIVSTSGQPQQRRPLVTFPPSRVEMQGVETLPGVANIALGRDTESWLSGATMFERVVYRDLYPHVDVFVEAAESSVRLTFETARPGALREAVLRSAASEPGLDEVLTATERYDVGPGGAFRFESDAQVAEVTITSPPTLRRTTHVGNGLTDVTTDEVGDVYAAGFTGSSEAVMTDPASGVRRPLDGYIVVAKVDRLTGDVEYMTVFGGSGVEWANTIAVDSRGRAFVGGGTDSTDFPVKNAIYEENQGGCAGGASDCAFDGVYARLHPSGELETSSYFGGRQYDDVVDVVLDGRERPRLALVTKSKRLPTSRWAFQNTGSKPTTRDPDSIDTDVYIASLDAGVRRLGPATYLAGEKLDIPSEITMSPRGRVWLVGGTGSPSFPSTTGPTKRRNYDAFIAKLTRAGRLVASRTFGGRRQDAALGVVFDRRRGRLYTAGWTESSDFPARRSPDLHVGGEWDGFVARLNPRTLRLRAARFIGGTGHDVVYALAKGPRGGITVTGGTNSTDLPTKAAVQEDRGRTASCETNTPECFDAFVASMRPRGLRLRYSTYLGGSSWDEAYGVTTWENETHVVGGTWSVDFPTHDTTEARPGGFITTIAE